MAEIWLLGPVQIVADRRTVEVGPPQRRAVLAALAVDAGRVVTPETVIDRVWGENAPDLARRSLHAHIARIRRLLEDSGDSPGVTRRSGGYLLEVPPERVDLHRFRGLIDRAVAAQDDQAPLLREALSLWRGEPLAGLTGEWADRVRQSLHQHHLDTVVAWARAELRRRNTNGLIQSLVEPAREHPFHEPLIAVLMRAMDAAGNRTEALDLYTRTRARLVAELGVEPGTELRETHQEILRGTNRSPARHEVTWPHRIGIVPPPADGFQDRAIELGTGPAQVISGLGGVGKTQLAAHTARQAWPDLDLLIWITAASRDALISAYAQAGAELGLGPGDPAPEAAATRLLAWLASTDRRWLVVLDDVAQPGDVRGLWPPDHPTGRTIVTTRRRDATLLRGRDLVEVGVFSTAEAIDFLTRTLPPHLADDVPGVAADLGSLPLALGHAVAYMVDQDLTCGEYRSRFANRNRRLAGLFPDPDTLFDTNAGTVATTWLLSIEAADKLPPAGVARPLLEIASLLDANGIPETVFSTEAALRYVGADSSDVRDGLRGLYRFHLITHEDGLVRMHGLLQRAVREQLPGARAIEVVRAAADALVACWPSVDVEQGAIFRANAGALQQNGSATMWRPGEGIHPLLIRTIDSLGSAGQLTAAIRLAREWSEVAAARLGPAHHDALVLRNKLAGWLGDAGLLEDALACLQKLVIDMAALGPDHPTAIAARQNLGYQYGQAGDLPRAVAELTKALADHTRTLGPDHPTVFGCHSQLAYWRGKAGDTAGAVADLDSLEPRARRVLGPLHTITLDIRANRARWLGHAGDHTQASTAFADLLADAEKVLGSAHRDVSVYRHNAAYWRWQSGDAEGAARVFAEVLAQRLRMFGPKHRDTLATRQHLACVRAELGDPTALTDLESTVTDMTELFGDTHPATLSARTDLADLHGHLGNPTLAASALADILADHLRVLGAEHESTVRTQERLAHWQALPVSPQ
ncbi:FxSxx-COOH system tetratricopeptide repeat protein [Actinocrispum sp. NPDC049592]|uniref:FxSxx-COOH system tetratricopeptide repeat protein n=1 Tax=Actinocrispum sp. NPDC049592 TaxID=3154835 RepID=UPI003424F8A4